MKKIGHSLILSSVIFAFQLQSDTAQSIPPPDTSCKDPADGSNYTAIDSAETCTDACDLYDLRCDVDDSCGASFKNRTTTINGVRTIDTSCTCGPSGSQTQICEDEISMAAPETSIPTESPSESPTEIPTTSSSFPNRGISYASSAVLFLSVGFLVAFQP